MPTATQRDEASLLDLLTPLVRRWRWMVLLPLFVASGTAVYSLYVQTRTRRLRSNNARIAEVRDTPVLTTIDRAVPPFLRTWPRRRVMVILAGLGGLGLATVLAYALELRANLARESRPEYRSRVDAIRQARRELAGMFGRSG